MFQRIVPHAVVALCAVPASRALAATNVWTDAKSGREYVLLDGEMTRYEAESACLKQGYALFDLRYISDDERKDFLANTALDKLAWQSLYTGTARETRVAKMWQGAEEGVHGFTGSQVVLQKRGDKTTLAAEWHGEDEQARAVCMATDAFWYACTAHFRCTLKTGTTEYTTTTSYADFGATENEAMRRIIERTQDPAASGEAKCLLDTTSRLCRRLLP